jgi:hypothetical protein
VTKNNGNYILEALLKQLCHLPSGLNLCQSNYWATLYAGVTNWLLCNDWTIAWSPTSCIIHPQPVLKGTDVSINIINWAFLNTHTLMNNDELGVLILKDKVYIRSQTSGQWPTVLELFCSVSVKSDLMQVHARFLSHAIMDRWETSYC